MCPKCRAKVDAPDAPGLPVPRCAACVQPMVPGSAIAEGDGDPFLGRVVAGRFVVLRRIVLPLALPGIVAVMVYSFVTAWNEFIFALCFALDSRVKTLPIGLAEFSTEFNTDWGAVMAASMIMTLPIVLMFLVMQRVFVNGLMSGATKG